MIASGWNLSTSECGRRHTHHAILLVGQLQARDRAVQVLQVHEHVARGDLERGVTELGLHGRDGHAGADEVRGHRPAERMRGRVEPGAPRDLVGREGPTKTVEQQAPVAAGASGCRFSSSSGAARTRRAPVGYLTGAPGTNCRSLRATGCRPLRPCEIPQSCRRRGEDDVPRHLEEAASPRLDCLIEKNCTLRAPRANALRSIATASRRSQVTPTRCCSRIGRSGRGQLKTTLDPVVQVLGDVDERGWFVEHDDVAELYSGGLRLGPHEKNSSPAVIPNRDIPGSPR